MAASEETKAARRRGRPLRFDDVGKLQMQIEAYFASLKAHYEEREVFIARKYKTGKSKGDIMVGVDGRVLYDTQIERHYVEEQPATISDLAVFLNTSRETLLEYEDREEFVDTIKAAKDRISAMTERSLMTKTNVTGVIFNLKNNFGYRDATDITSGGDKLGSGLSPEAAAVLNKAMRSK